MKLQKKVIVFQIFIYGLFFLLTLNLILQFKFTSNLYQYSSLGFFLIVISLLVIAFKKSKSEYITISKSYLNISKYNIYVFIFTYAIASFTLTEQLKSIQNLTYFIVLFLASIFGIVYNLRTYLKAIER